MAIREIKYTVTADGIDPAAQQPGGIQGDHNATKLVFTLEQDFYESIINEADGKTVIYRFEGFDCLGKMTAGEPFPLVQTMTYPLENWLTKEGGTIKVHLVLSVMEGDNTIIDIYTFPTLLKLKENNVTAPSDYENLPNLAFVAKEAAKSAAQDAQTASNAKTKTLEAMLALESGSVIIFQGGNAKSRFSVDLAVDSEISDASENPVENRIVKKYVDNFLNDSTEARKIAEENAKKVKTIEDDLNGTQQKVEKLYVTDFGTKEVTEQNGSKTKWTYKIWSNGEAECYCDVTQLFNINTLWGGLEGKMYISSGQYNFVTFPFEFAENPNCTYSFDSNPNSVFAVPQGTENHTTTTHSFAIQFARPGISEKVEVTISWSVRGKTKEEE